MSVAPDTKKKKARASTTIERTTETPQRRPAAPAPRPAPAPGPSRVSPPARVLAFVASMIAGAWGMLVSAIERVSAFVGDWLFNGKKALYGLAVTRILFGITALGLLASNFSTRLYTFGSGSAWNGELAQPVSDFPQIWLFSAFHAAMGNDLVYTALYLLLAVLAVLFVLGWRFRLVLPVFFCLWVGFIEANDMVGDQGDNMFRIALLLLFFADPAARWSLDARRRAKSGEWFAPGSQPALIGTVFHNLALVALTAQVCFVYASGALYKAGGSPWETGYAVYNPLQTARFGTWPVLSDLVTTWGPMVVAFSWGSIILQVAFPLALLTRPTRLIALVGILSFHIGIAVLMGLPWFSLTMIAIDSIFIRDRTWERLSTGVARRWEASRTAPPPRAPASA
ncbi:HTTM domain-containing protein [Streptomyces sp. AC495_CC817]|uniref:HTTM domain-containing protein n=1 Tax=Streptomyces sp. AC495_CC817 TaxID=2823900 RepID=UPI001C27D76B|nr:HTTM domain-containing protein [Streptomyces sp. AC495_CC817]